MFPVCLICVFPRPKNGTRFFLSWAFKENIYVSSSDPLKPCVHSTCWLSGVITMLCKPQCCLQVRCRCIARQREKKICDFTSGWELIFQIYLSGNGLEPSGASQMALGELKWMCALKAGDHFYAFIPAIHAVFHFCSFLPGLWEADQRGCDAVRKWLTINYSGWVFKACYTPGMHALIGASCLVEAHHVCKNMAHTCA